RPVIPVLVGRTAMPKVEQLPESLADFAYRNGVRVDTGQDFDTHIDRLTRAIGAILVSRSAIDGAEAAGAIAERSRPPPTVARQSWFVWGAAVTALLVAAVAAGTN